MFNGMYGIYLQIFTEGSNEVPKDYVKAMQHFEKAADQVRSYLYILIRYCSAALPEWYQNHGDGYSGLGMMYLNGYGVEKVNSEQKGMIIIFTPILLDIELHCSTEIFPKSS